MYERMLDLSEEPACEEMTVHCGKAGALFERLNTALEGETGTPESIRKEIRLGCGAPQGNETHLRCFSGKRGAGADAAAVGRTAHTSCKKEIE